MIKNLKLNIKNTQLSKILKKPGLSSVEKTEKPSLESKDTKKPSSSVNLAESARGVLKKKPINVSNDNDVEDTRPKVQLHKKKAPLKEALHSKVPSADVKVSSAETSSTDSASVKISPSTDASSVTSKSPEATSKQESVLTQTEGEVPRAVVIPAVATKNKDGSLGVTTGEAQDKPKDAPSITNAAQPVQPQGAKPGHAGVSRMTSSFTRNLGPQKSFQNGKPVKSSPLIKRDATAGSSTRPPLRKPFIRESFSAQQARISSNKTRSFIPPSPDVSPNRVRLGPTGKHINDLKEEVRKNTPAPRPTSSTFSPQRTNAKSITSTPATSQQETSTSGFRSPAKKKAVGQEDSRRRERSTLRPSGKMGKADLMRSMDEDGRWRKRRVKKSKTASEVAALRPSSLSVRTPILVKDLAVAMKLKASELIGKLFLQGVAITLNDYLDDETTIALLGQEFGCEITIDTSKEEMIAVTSQTILQEIEASSESDIIHRPPVIAFMGHVDHGKTSLIDRIRSSNRVEGESGSITQHIAAFKCETTHGPLTVLDTPGHAAFEDMRERGAKVTDVIVLVIAGDDGIMPQTDEAIRHAKSVNATIVVAINKCDKPSFDVDTVYRQLSERELLPEAWGGQTITVNCSAKTGEGIDSLLELVALQSEVLELRANGSSRARGTVIEAQLHKGLGNVATVLVQNGSLKHGDPLVLGCSWGRIKTLRNENGQDVDSVAPGLPAFITGLDSLPSAGDEFIVVATEKEARNIAQARLEQHKELNVAASRRTIDSLFDQAKQGKKFYNVILRADVQGSLEALRVALINIKSDKIEIKIVDDGIGEISESDVELASASDATIIGFHTQVEPHTQERIKEKSICVKSFDVIYHAVDSVKDLMRDSLDKLPQEQHLGVASIKAIFKSSHTGKIAGCLITEGKVERGVRAKIMRDGTQIAEARIGSIRRENDDAKEVVKGYECGIVLDGFKDIMVDDEMHAYNVIYIDQEL